MRLTSTLLRQLQATRLASTASVTSPSALSSGHHKVLVIGGGTAGLSLANQLYSKFALDSASLGPGDIAIVDAAESHHFQPGWTLVGSGLKDKKDLVKPLDSLIPSHISHIKSNAKAFSPQSNTVVLEDGRTVKYDYLVVAAGLQVSE